MGKLLFILGQVVWGAPQTILGLAVFLTHANRPHLLFHGAVVTHWRNMQSLSLGPFIFVGETPHFCEGTYDPDPNSPFGRMIAHEYGHSIQSLILGPLYLPLVGLPSVLWANMPRFRRLRRARNMSYYEFGPERNASNLGEAVLGVPAQR